MVDRNRFRYVVTLVSIRYVTSAPLTRFSIDDGRFDGPCALIPSLNTGDSGGHDVHSVIHGS